MNRALLIAPMLLLVSPPAFSQNAPGGDGRDRDSSSSRTDRDKMDRDLDEILRGIGDYGRGGLRRGGAAFFLRNGDAVVAVRCDPQDSMRACVDSTLTLLERAKAAQGK
jgi:hypothetical protein